MLASMAALKAQLDAERAASVTAAQRIAELERERDNLRSAHERLRQELELLKRRIIIAKAERPEDVDQLELEFAEKMRAIEQAAGTLGMAKERPASEKTPASDSKPRGKRTHNSGTGRRESR